MDFKAIANGLATAVGTLTVAGETATATSQLPDNVGTLALLVYPPEGNLAFLMGGPHLDAIIVYPVRLLRDPITMLGRSDALLDWATALWPRPQANYTLNIAGVLTAEATSIRLAIDGGEYSSVDGTFGRFDMVEMLVNVHVYELATFAP